MAPLITVTPFSTGSQAPVRMPWLAVVAVATALLGACAPGGGAAQPPAASATVTPDGALRIEVAFAQGVVTGGAVRYAVPVGSAVELVVAADVADEVHVHGYDRRSYVTAGASTTLRFVADLPGVFDVELEQRGTPLAQLAVS